MMNNTGFIDQILSKLGTLVEATGINKAIMIVEIGQMLVTLQNGLQNEEKQHEKTINELQTQIDALVKQLNGDEPIEKIVIPMGPVIETKEVNTDVESSS